MSSPSPDSVAPARPAPSSRLFRKLGISLLSTIALIGVAELGCRLAGFGPDAGELQYEYDSELQYVPRPSQQTAFGRDDDETGERRQSLSINRYGMRGDDFPLEKPPGERRVVVLGDSLTFGPGVPDAAVWPVVLEGLLRSEGAQGVRVANAAVNGYSTYHYRKWIETRAAEFDPDLVLIGVYVGNDMVLAGAGGNALEPGLENALRRTGLGDALVTLYRDHLWQRMRARNQGTTVEAVADELLQYAGIQESSLTLPQQRDLWLHALQQLEVAAEWSRAADVQLACVLIPASWMTTKNADDARIYTWLQRQVEALGIPTIAPLEELRARRGELWLDWDPGHFDVSGHAILAEAILAQWAAAGLPL